MEPFVLSLRALLTIRKQMLPRISTQESIWAERQLLMQQDRTDHNASQRLKHAQDRAQPRPGILHAVLQEDRSTDVIQEGDQRNDPEIRQDAPKLQRRSQRAVDQAHNGHEQADIEGERLPVFLLQNARALHVQQLERPRKDGQHSKQEAALRARRDIF